MIKPYLLGSEYENTLSSNNRKSMGKYYTPNFIIEYIINRTLVNADVVKDPYIKVIDPSCGAGYFLISAYNILEKKFSENLEILKEKYKTEKYILELNGEKKELIGSNYWKKEHLQYHILKNCIYGADKDLIAVELTILNLIQNNPNFSIDNLNIIACDSLIYWEKMVDNTDVSINKLIEFWNRKYDYVIGNPPYIGHKKLDLAYKSWLSKEYKSVFKDKSDISFCFFKRIHDILSKDGISGIITSRYFMESPTGSTLRKYLMENVDMLEIVDFYGTDVFKGVGVSTAIYFFQRKKIDKVKNHIDIHKLNSNYKVKSTINIAEEINTDRFLNFKVLSKNLSEDRWMLIPDKYNNIYRKIQDRCTFKLDEIAQAFQGIITGCDKAFIISQEDIMNKDIERNIIKPWIKNKSVYKYKITEQDLYLIYSNNIDDFKNYQNSINFIECYKSKLEKRREVKNGIRKWYELQWGRKEKLFESKKIIFPYKSNTNRFAIDYNGFYFSADIYGLNIKEEYEDTISLEYLVGLLNSSVYEFYFKLFAKQMGKGIYDYYPNSILDLNIITNKIISTVEEIATEIMVLKNKNNMSISENKKIESMTKEIDSVIMNYFNFSKYEENLIRKTIILK